MSEISLLRVGCVVFCVAIVIGVGVIVAVVDQWPLAVRAMVMEAMAICLLAGTGLVAIGAIRTLIRAEDVSDRAEAAVRNS